MQARPDTRLGPVPQSAPGGHSRAAHDLTGHISPGHSLAQDVDDAGQGNPVRHRQPSGVTLPPRRPLWQQRDYSLPQFIGDKAGSHDVGACQRTWLSPLGRLVILPE